MKWLASGGGPLLLLPESALMLWHGHKLEGESCSDYERACEVNGYIGTINVGSAHGLVLGDEPLQTACHLLPGRTGAILVRWRYADNEESIRRHLRDIPDSTFRGTAISYRVASTPCVLFDSAVPGDELNLQDCLRIPVVPGTYAIKSGAYAPDASTAIVLHRLLLID